MSAAQRVALITGAASGIGRATAVASARAEGLGGLPPRTLAFVFGDHGFRVGDDGTPSEGGASPEEVLVPAYAWVVGEMH